MNREQAKEALRFYANDPDRESAHEAADDVLCQLLIALGYVDVVAEFEKNVKWYA